MGGQLVALGSDDDEEVHIEIDEADTDDDDDDDDEVMWDYQSFPRNRRSEIPADIYDDVEIVHPRRSFFGARNYETVKDCECFRRLPLIAGNFLGARSDKVVSGSDDGNFFVWDKDTGKLEGIWEGDGSVVNGEISLLPS